MRTRPASACGAASESAKASETIDRLARLMGVSPWASRCLQVTPNGNPTQWPMPRSRPRRGSWKPLASAGGNHLDRLAVDEGADIGDNVRIIDLVVLDTDITEMGGEHHIVELAERMIDRQRLDVEHIEAGAAETPGGQRCDQRLLVHDRAARRVDQIGGRLHQ